MRSFAIYLLAFLTVLSISAAGATYTGKVVDTDGEPISGVNIQTDVSSVMTTTTDDSGEFVLETGDESIKYITFSHISYQPAMKNIKQVKSGEQIRVILQQSVYPEQKIRVTAMRAKAGLTPVAFSDFTAEEIERDYTVEDFPVLLESTPNMYTISYTGGDVGASEFYIRGFDSKRIGVYINGIPLNDPEDRFTYFYDLADFAAEVEDIQVQRGVGNSLYGDATFGGSINIASAGIEAKRKISVSTGYGRYYSDDVFISEIRRQSVEFNSGLIDGRWSLSGRYSKLYSGGYREEAWYDGFAYSLSLSRIDPNMTTTVNVYAGPMQAHHAWYGVTRDKLAENRRYNPTPYDWINYAEPYRFNPYDNEIDDFNQPHYELHNTYKLSEKATLKNTLYYIRGKGYYEEYRLGDVSNYNIPSSMLINPDDTLVDLVRQLWVTKNQYGWNPQLELEHKDGSLTLGGSFFYFNSEHWGQVVWAENVNETFNPLRRYYAYWGDKISASLYALEYFRLTDKIRLMGNLQLRFINYDFDQSRLGGRPGYNYNVNWLFLSPRAGITYNFNEKTEAYFSIAVASREPRDNMIYDGEAIGDSPQLAQNSVDTVDGVIVYDFGKPIIDAERVYNFELGTKLRNRYYRIGVNLFWMEFRNEIIQEGGIDDQGRLVVGNADRSVHSGIELEGSVRILDNLNFSGNFSYNYNRIREYLAISDLDFDGEPDTTDYSGNPTAGFPESLTNLLFEYRPGPVRLVYRLRGVGKQFIDNGANDSLAIDPYWLSSVTASVQLGNLAGIGQFSLSATVDNLFNKRYEQSGYSYYDGFQWVGEYYVGAERNFFVQLKWELR